ncbi:MAG: hypothetical protein VB082_10750 [Christensenella sp.]|nr:hypothetical protein [Christensenella sp.]
MAKGKKSQMLPGLTPPGAENIMGGSTQNGTGMLYNKNNPNKMTKNGINLGASAYNYHKGKNGTVNMSDMQAGSVMGGPQPQPTQVPKPVSRTKFPWDEEPDAQPQYEKEYETVNIQYHGGNCRRAFGLTVAVH